MKKTYTKKIISFFTLANIIKFDTKSLGSVLMSDVAKPTTILFYLF